MKLNKNYKIYIVFPQVKIKLLYINIYIDKFEPHIKVIDTLKESSISND